MERSTPPSDPGSRLRAASLAAAFTAFLVMPLVGALVRAFAPDVADEKRPPAPAPCAPTDLAAWRAFPAAATAWWQDRAGFRRALVAAQAKVRYGAFGCGSNRDVLVGSDGWLFLRSGPAAGADHAGHEEEWLGMVRDRRDTLRRSGVAYLFVIAPDKQSVHPEQLPAWAAAAMHGTEDERTAAALERGEPDACLLLEAPLRRAAEAGPVYEKTDTHWNDRGSAAAACAVLERLTTPRGPVRTAVVPGGHADRRVRSGDLAQLAGLAGIATDDDPVLTALERLPEAAGHVRGTFELPGTGRVEDPLVVVHGDSFAPRLAPFLTKAFRRVIVVLDKQVRGAEAPDSGALAAAVAAERPDVVVQVLVERNLAASPAPLPLVTPSQPTAHSGER